MAFFLVAWVQYRRRKPNQQPLRYGIDAYISLMPVGFLGNNDDGLKLYKQSIGSENGIFQNDLIAIRRCLQ
jgi:hypothetical protein